MLNTCGKNDYGRKFDRLWIHDLNVVNSGGMTGEISGLVVAVVHVGAMWLVDKLT